MSLSEDDLLYQYNHEKDGKARKKILETALDHDLKKSIPLYIEALKDPNVENKAFAIRYLGENCVTEALKPLIELTQLRLEIYDELISNIVKIAKLVDLEQIIRFLEIENINLKKSIPIILGKIGDKKAVKILIELIDDKNPIVRRNSVRALEKLIEPSDLRHLIEKLGDNNLEVRKTTIHVLGNIGDKSSVKPLLELLKDPEPDIRRHTVRALYRILKGESSLKTIYNTLKSKNSVLRLEVIKLLGLIENPDSLKYLTSLLNSSNGKIRTLALNVIVKISKAKKLMDNSILQGLEAKEWQIRRYCAKIIGVIGDDSNIDSLFNLLNSTKSSVRRAAIEALSKLGGNKIIEISKKYLENPDWRIRRSVVDL
ncbi:MAG: HEAT repeat domain-containing protein, partial [Candidatus Hodarchaeota archaeon]